MLEEWPLVTHPLLKSSFIDDGKPYLAESPFFGQQMGLIAQWPIPDELKSATKKQMKNFWQKYKVRVGFEPVISCTKSQYHNH